MHIIQLIIKDRGENCIPHLKVLWSFPKIKVIVFGNVGHIQYALGTPPSYYSEVNILF